MKSKKAQSELITTVLIILLVLAAIIIVWQVVTGVLNQGKTSVDAQSSCIGFSMQVNVVNPTNTTVNVVPSKDIQGFRIYVGGAVLSTLNESTPVSAMSSGTFTNAVALASGAEVKTAGKINGQWCDGINKDTV